MENSAKTVENDSLEMTPDCYKIDQQQWDWSKNSGKQRKIVGEQWKTEQKQWENRA